MCEDIDIQDEGEVTELERNEFLDLPFEEHDFWKNLKEEASKRRIKTMRELLLKVPYYELRKDEILKEGEAKAFINLLMSYGCFQMLNLSYPLITKQKRKKSTS